MQNIKDEIKDIICEVMNYEFKPDDLNQETNLVEDLEMDSLIYIEMIIEIENRLDITIDPENLSFDLIKIYGSFEKMILSYLTKGEDGSGTKE